MLDAIKAFLLQFATGSAGPTVEAFDGFLRALS